MQKTERERERAQNHKRNAQIEEMSILPTQSYFGMPHCFPILNILQAFETLQKWGARAHLPNFSGDFFAK